MFDDPDGEQGIVQDIYDDVQAANETTYPKVRIVRHANTGLDRVITKIIGLRTGWQFNSTNDTKLPIGYTDLIAGQQDVKFDDEYLTLVKPLQVLMPDGVTWKELEAVDDNDLTSQSGIPTKYNKMGRSFLLDYIPNYSWRINVEGRYGIKAFFEKRIERFTVNDTTKEPGFAPHLHDYIPTYCKYRFALSKGLPELGELKNQLKYYEGNLHRGGRDPGEIVRYYSRREGDMGGRLIPRWEDNR